MGEAGAKPVYRVGDLLVDAGQARVARGDIDIPLPKLSFDLLMALIQAAPHIATTDELMERVWPGLVVGPETVSQRVSLVRAALEDDPKEPRYIAAVRGRGYRLVAPVAAVATEPANAFGAAQPAAPSSALDSAGSRAGTEALADSLTHGSSATAGRPRARRLVAIGAFTALAAIALLAVVFFRGDKPPISSSAPLPERSIAVLPFESMGAIPNGDTLALGMSEAVLHQLAALRELTVVARTSSFAFKDREDDARDIGRKLGARYLLDGSVQYEGEKMRVTAQLIDGTTGSQVWSVRIDRTARDVFAVQDEIALEVARALELSLDASTTDKLTGQGTANFDAYLEFLRGRQHAATLRIPQVKEAITEFTRATQIDPTFAAAYVELAEAEVLVAEFDVSEERHENFEQAVEHGKALIERALQLDPSNGHAYVERAYFKAFTDLAGAEADYRRGIALSPSYAKAYAGLASVLYENPTRWTETLEALDRARKLDPLEPRYDVTKAVFLLYRRSDIKAANDLLVDVLQREPLYQPALMRLGELRWHFEGRFAEAVKYSEQALALDPFSEWTRRVLVRIYIDLQDAEDAARVIATAPRPLPVRSIPLQALRRDWVTAGEAVYAADEDETLSPIDESVAAIALRMHARATRQYARSIALLERTSGISWDDKGDPQLPTRPATPAAAVGLADVLMLNNERPRAIRLLNDLLTHMDLAAKNQEHGDFWHFRDRPVALALLGDVEGAMQALEKSYTVSLCMPQWWIMLEVDPVFEPLRADPRFQRLLAGARAHARKERDALERLRTEGLIPVQTAASRPADSR